VVFPMTELLKTKNSSKKKRTAEDKQKSFHDGLMLSGAFELMKDALCKAPCWPTTTQTRELNWCVMLARWQLVLCSCKMVTPLPMRVGSSRLRDSVRHW
jgi:hypothetical protein